MRVPLVFAAALGCAAPAAPDPAAPDSGTAPDWLNDPTARQPTKAGEWYPADPRELDALVAGLVEPVSSTKRPARALLTPHAGIRFSGPIAGQAWGRVEVPEVLIVLGPNHYEEGVDRALWVDGPWIVPGHGLAVHAEGTEALAEALPDLQGDREAFGHHEIELNLPFLQYVRPDVQMVVAAWRDNQAWHVRDITDDEIESAGLAVASVVRDLEAQGEEVGLLLTSDLVHYLDLEETNRQDALLLEPIEQMDPWTLLDRVRDQRLSMCGEVPVAIGMVALLELGYDRFDVLTRTTSHDASGNADRVVGYPAGVVYR